MTHAASPASVPAPCPILLPIYSWACSRHATRASLTQDRLPDLWPVPWVCSELLGSWRSLSAVPERESRGMTHATVEARHDFAPPPDRHAVLSWRVRVTRSGAPVAESEVCAYLGGARSCASAARHRRGFGKRPAARLGHKHPPGPQGQPSLRWSTGKCPPPSPPTHSPVQNGVVDVRRSLRSPIACKCPARQPHGLTYLRAKRRLCLQQHVPANQSTSYQDTPWPHHGLRTPTVTQWAAPRRTAPADRAPHRNTTWRGRAAGGARTAAS